MGRLRHGAIRVTCLCHNGSKWPNLESHRVTLLVHGFEYCIMLPLWMSSSHLFSDLLLILQSPPQMSPLLWSLSNFIEFATLFWASIALGCCIFNALHWSANLAAFSSHLWTPQGEGVCWPISGPFLTAVNVVKASASLGIYWYLSQDPPNG